ncbi:hypothetical protein AE07_02242 [Enterobacter cloacae BWH 43]|nr:hypothetical protein AE07_02242 [Enterobacter cloacae BWH 43]GJL39474.1 hypothetical protein TUM17577_06830 [Enterobacter asburiae]
MEDCLELSECGALFSRVAASPYPAYKVNANGNGCCRFWCLHPLPVGEGRGEGNRPHRNNTS